MRILKIESLPNSKTWVDRDFIILHACFQILKDYVEKESRKYDTFKDEKFINEVETLYKWWNKRNEDIKEKNVDQQIKEDNEMLLRLMKIRTSLWI
jgi:hypothetical protein